MNLSILLCRGLLLGGTIFQLAASNTEAFTIFLQEQGALTGSIVGGGGSVIINPLGSDYWNVIVQDARIGNSIVPTFSLAFVEPELVSGMTAYNNVQVLSVSPGILVFDVLSDEFSPYAMIVANSGTAPLQNTDIEMISLMFTDYADSVPEPGFGSLLLAGAAVALWKGKSEARNSATPA